jgi:predicted ATPase
LRNDASVALRVRVGIDTGVAVVPASLEATPSPDSEISGNPPNVAHRLQAIAAPGHVVISDATRALVGGLFDCHSLGPQRLKGLVDPVHAWQVVREKRFGSRFQAFHRASSLTPLAGREQELALLLERWQRVRDGVSQVVQLSGEPGIGKSRLLLALRERLRHEGAQTLALQCSPAHENSAFFPVIDCLHRVLRFTPDMSTTEKLDRIEERLRVRYGRSAHDASLLAALLSIATDARFPPLLMTPQHQKDEAIRALVELCEAAARERPTLILLEDAHWADPSTREVLGRLVRSLPGFPVFVVVTCRPDFDDSELREPAVERIVLSRLNRAQRAAIVASLCGGRELPPALVEGIAARSDGVPLFLEELTKSVLESLGTASGDADREPAAQAPASIPATLRDSLMARLDRLGAGKLVAQVGSCIGRHFSLELLASVVPLARRELEDAIAALNASGLTFALETPEGTVFTFKHALVQDTARDTLLESARRPLHLQIAGALEARTAETPPTDPALIAHHYTEAGVPDRAVVHWKAAGTRAAARSENLEAISHLRRGVECLSLLPRTDLWIREELDICTTLGAALSAARGYADAEVKITYARAAELCRLTRDDLRQFAVWRAQFNVALLRAEYGAAGLLAARVVELARAQGKPEFHLGASLISGLNALFTGRPELANTHLKSSMSYFDPLREARHVAQHGILLGVTAGAYRARALWMLGHPDQALACCNETVEQARTPSISLSVTQAMTMLAIVHQARGENDLARHRIHQALKHAREQGHAYWSALGGIVAGWLRAQDGQVDAGVAEISRNIATYHSTGALMARSWFLLLLGEAYLRGGRHDEALAALAGALRHVESTGEAYYAAEIHRCWGEALLAAGGSGADAAAEVRFTRALEIARAQGARAWELRSATSLARLWQAQGKGRQGAAILQRAFGTFTEGFQTRDLREAADLLARLALP